MKSLGGGGGGGGGVCCIVLEVCEIWSTYMYVQVACTCTHPFTRMSSSSHTLSVTTASAWPSKEASNDSSPSKLTSDTHTVAREESEGVHICFHTYQRNCQYNELLVYYMIHTSCSSCDAL